MKNYKPFVMKPIHIIKTPSVHFTKMTHCPESSIFFFQTSWKDGLSQKIVLEYDLFCIERWYFFFSKIWSYPLDGKWKMIFLKKIHGNMIFSSNVSKRWSFQKKPPWDMTFLVLSGKMVFFPRKRIFSLGGKRGAIFFKKYMEIWNFLCTRTGVTNAAPCPLSKHIKDHLIP